MEAMPKQNVAESKNYNNNSGDYCDENFNVGSEEQNVAKSGDCSSEGYDDDVPNWLFPTNPSDAMMTVNTFKMTDCKTVIRIYQMGRILDRILNEAGVK